MLTVMWGLGCAGGGWTGSSGLSQCELAAAMQMVTGKLWITKRALRTPLRSSPQFTPASVLDKAVCANLAWTRVQGGPGWLLDPDLTAQLYKGAHRDSVGRTDNACADSISYTFRGARIWKMRGQLSKQQGIRSKRARKAPAVKTMEARRLEAH